MNKLLQFIRDTRGAAAVEYMLLGTILAASVAAGAATLGPWVGNQFNTVSNSIEEQNENAFP